MPSLLDEPAAVALNTAPAERLRAAMAAMRLSFTWFGTRKTLTSQQKALAAESFGAEGEFLSAGKKLLETRHEKYQAVTAIRGRAIQYWRGKSLPYPEPGIRLVQQNDLDAINAQMTTLRAELIEAVAELDRHYEELKRAARSRLGALYNESDYPARLDGLFEMSWDFPSIEPRRISSSFRPSCINRSVSACRPASTRRCGWRNRPFWRSSLSWWTTSPSGSPGSRTAGPKSFATPRWRT